MSWLVLTHQRFYTAVSKAALAAGRPVDACMIDLRVARTSGFGFQRQSMSILPWKSLCRNSRVRQLLERAHRDTHTYTHIVCISTELSLTSFAKVLVCARHGRRSRPAGTMHDDDDDDASMVYLHK